MSRSSSSRRGRGRPRREYRIRVRGERREHPDYDKLARALLEHAAMEEAKRRANVTDATDNTATTSTKINVGDIPSMDDELDGDADD
ncbi:MULTISPECIES: hypothetical protein [Microbacterium]|uniref:hypothetical protein n=1 Tax=Microbacterium TaxID=33882 RepID=UPI0027852B0E|nr:MULTISPECIES: hypothetical protein [Microbacterium]MDQ1076221.1 putative ArsR family transcriptional regulator [Microbacterium sp. SORGH_AS_0969]MDQ1116458.1 putative ArsR family transcriptional regulator [Microbacterium testaceum]